MKKNIVNIILSLILILPFILFSPVIAEENIIECDGVWFLGFNLHKDLFDAENSQKIRASVAYAIDKPAIQKIMGTSIIPTGVVPPSMLGFDPQLNPFNLDIKKSKTLLKEAGYNPNDKRLKKLSLLHTDGKKTIEIAQSIKNNLAKIGFEIKLKQISYKDKETWQKELKGGRYHFFLMGYKAAPEPNLLIGDIRTKYFHAPGCANLPDADDQVFFSSYTEAIKNKFSPDSVCKPAKDQIIDTQALLEPLFSSGGEANFTFYSNLDVDNDIEKLKATDLSLVKIREPWLIRINRTISADLPVVPLFYITKL